MLTTALGQTQVVLPDNIKARHEALRALQINDIRQKVQEALKVQKKTPLLPMQKDTTKKIQELTRQMLTMKQVKPIHIRVTTSRSDEPKQKLICHHCGLKGHYARNCHTRRKLLIQCNAPVTTSTRSVITNANRYMSLSKVTEEARPTKAPSHLSHTSSLRRPVLGSGLDQASPILCPSQDKPRPLLDATRIDQLIEKNGHMYSKE